MTREFPETIKTTRLLLRPYRWADIDNLMKFATNEDWSRYI